MGRHRIFSMELGDGAGYLPSGNTFWPSNIFWSSTWCSSSALEMLLVCQKATRVTKLKSSANVQTRRAHHNNANYYERIPQFLFLLPPNFRKCCHSSGGDVCWPQNIFWIRVLFWYGSERC